MPALSPPQSCARKPSAKKQALINKQLQKQSRVNAPQKKALKRHHHSNTNSSDSSSDEDDPDTHKRRKYQREPTPKQIDINADTSEQEVAKVYDIPSSGDERPTTEPDTEVAGGNGYKSNTDSVKLVSWRYNSAKCTTSKKKLS